MVKNDAIIILRPLWFLNKRNRIKIEECKRVIITKNMVQSGGWADIEIYDSNNSEVIKFLAQIYKFELLRFVKFLAKNDVNIDLEGSSFIDD